MNAIEQLQRERENLQSRIGEIDVLVSEYQKWEDRVAAVVGRKASDILTDNVNQTNAKENAVSDVDGGPKPSPKEDFEAAVQLILGTSQTPLDRTVLLNELRENGIRVGGADERNTLSARLSRLPYVVNVRGKGYTLKARENEFVTSSQSHGEDQQPSVFG